MAEIVIGFEGVDYRIATHGEADFLHRSYARKGTFYEVDLLKKIREEHPAGTAVYDVGANIGNHALFFAKVMGSHVRAFEPFDASFRLLLRNIEANGAGNLVAAEQIALGDAAGMVAFDIPDPANHGTVKARPDPAGLVRILPLDVVAAGGPPVGTLKIDVEDSEEAVLKGGIETIRRDRPRIFVEARDAARFAPVAALLGGLGYTPAGRYCATDTYFFRHESHDPER